MLDKDLSTVRNDLLLPIEHVLDKMLCDIFSPNNINTAKSVQTYPKANVFKTKDQFIIVFAVPGVKKEDIQLECKDDKTIILKGKMNSKYCPTVPPEFYIKEIRQTRFERSFLLPDNVKGTSPVAHLEDGLLTLTWELNLNKDPTTKIIPIE